MNPTDVLNTREIASLIWGLIIFIYASSKSKDVIKSLVQLLKLATTGILLKIFLLMILFIIVVDLIFFQLNLTFTTFIKDSILWFFATGIVLMMKASKAINFKFFKEVLIDSVKLSVIIEFVVQLYTFNIVIELVLVPFVLLIVGMNTLSKRKIKYKMVNTLTTYILGVIGLMYIIYSLSQILNNFESFATYDNLASLVFPIIMTILFLPFVYILSIFTFYDELVGKHGRLRMLLERNNNKYINYIIRQVVESCKFNVQRWSRFNEEYANQLLYVEDEQEIKSIFLKFNNEFRKK